MGGALAGRQVQAVLDQIAAIRFGDLGRQEPGVFDLLAIEPHICAEACDIAKLERVDGSRRHYGDLQAHEAGRCKPAPPQIHGACAYQA